MTPAILLILGLPSGQTQNEQKHTFSESQRLLELRMAHLDVVEARTSLERETNLVADGLVPRARIDQLKVELSKAEIRYQQFFLHLFSAIPNVTIDSAVKSREADGSKTVTVVLRNVSGAVLDYRQFGISTAEVAVPDQLQLRRLNDVFVALKDEEGVVISKPYERYLKQLDVGKSYRFPFKLLKDVDSILLSLRYAGHLDERRVFLEKDPSANMVTVQSEEYSQEADLGEEVVYNLRLERFTSSSDRFKMIVFNLPLQIETEFIRSIEDTARLNYITFTESETTKAIVLRLLLPTLSDESEFAIDEPIRFWVVVVPPSQVDQISETVRHTAGEIASIQAGKVDLELIPRGRGELEVRAKNLYRQANLGETVDLDVSIRNIGTRDLTNVKVVVEAPVQWESEVRPPVTSRLVVGGEERIRILLAPNETVSVGEYSLRIATLAYTGNTPVESADKTARIRIVDPPKTSSHLMIGGAFIVSVLAMVVIGVKLTRR